MKRVSETIGQVDVIGYSEGEGQVVVPGWKSMSPGEARQRGHELLAAAARAPQLNAQAKALAKLESHAADESMDAALDGQAEVHAWLRAHHLDGLLGKGD